MAKKACTALGLGLVLVGLLGFAFPGFLGLHLSVLHDFVHLLSGGLSLWFGMKGTRDGARVFCLVFGAVYGLLGVLGFVLGGPGVSIAGLIEHDARLWRPVPHHLELGTPDHVIHLVLGLAFVVAAVTTKRWKAPLDPGTAAR